MHNAGYVTLRLHLSAAASKIQGQSTYLGFPTMCAMTSSPMVPK